MKLPKFVLLYTLLIELVTVALLNHWSVNQIKAFMKETVCKDVFTVLHTLLSVHCILCGSVYVLLLKEVKHQVQSTFKSTGDSGSQFISCSTPPMLVMHPKNLSNWNVHYSVGCMPKGYSEVQAHLSNGNEENGFQWCIPNMFAGSGYDHSRVVWGGNL